MNTIVFQEMREARALAYSARAMLTSPTDLSDSYSFYAFIGSQNDKLQQAVEAFDMIINDMPQSDKAFDIAKTALDARLRTQRTTGSRVISSYLQSKDLGLSQPLNQYVYEHLADIDMDDLVACQQRRVKDRTYIYGILGDINGMDAKYLRTLGPVEQVSLEEVFGY